MSQSSVIQDHDVVFNTLFYVTYFGVFGSFILSVAYFTSFRFYLLFPSLLFVHDRSLPFDSLNVWVYLTVLNIVKANMNVFDVVVVAS